MPSPNKRLATPESEADDDVEMQAGPSTPTKSRTAKKAAMRLPPTPRSPGDVGAAKVSFANSTSPTPASGRVHHSVLFGTESPSLSGAASSPLAVQASLGVKQEPFDAAQTSLFRSGPDDEVKLEDAKPSFSGAVPLSQAKQGDGGAMSSAVAQVEVDSVKQEFDEGGLATGRPRRQRAKRSYAMYAASRLENGGRMGEIASIIPFTL